MFQSLWGLLAEVVDWIFDLVRVILYDIFEWLFSLGKVVGQFMWDALPSSVQTWLNDEPWLPLAQYMNVVDYFIPIYGGMAIIATVITVVAWIRLVRWVLRVAPLVNG